MNKFLKGVTIVGVATSTLVSGQQVIKRITDNSSATVVELFVLRNGSDASNVVGENGFNTWSSNSSSSVKYYNQDGTISYTPTNATYTNTTLSNEQISNWTFSTTYAQIDIKTDYTASDWSTPLNFSTTTVNSEADALQDVNTNTDLLKSKVFLPHTLADGSAIPIGTVAIVTSRKWIDLNTGVASPGNKRLLFERNGSTWIPKVPSITFWSSDNLQSIDGNGQVLGTYDINAGHLNFFVVYPNPASNYISINTKEIVVKMEVKVYDMAGKIVLQGSMISGEKLDVRNLASGNYLITIVADDKKSSLKFIKK